MKSKSWPAICFWLSATLLSLPATSEERTTENEWELPEISVCLGEQPLTLPLVPLLMLTQPDNSLMDFRPMRRMDETEIKGLVEASPYEARSILYLTPGSRSSEPPLLEMLLGHPSPYNISDIRIYSGSWSSLDKWMRYFPENKTTQSGTHRFIPKAVSFFGQPVQATCYHGIPPRSQDPLVRQCSLGGLSPNNSSIQFSINTGRDLEGHWPTQDFDWETLDMTGWAEPLAALEQAILNLNTKDEDKSRCN